MGPEALAQVLRPLTERFAAARHPDLLVGLEPPDDAAVLRVGGRDAIVVTIDFFPPIVDDPYAYGAMAAANAMSDVYAMGGEVLLALNVAVFPEDLGVERMAAILAGGADKVLEAGGVLVGGHTLAGAEPMYGLAVVGRVEPERLLRKSGARPGDALVLTKPIGSGLVTTALRAGRAEPLEVEAAVRAMSQLNRVAGRAAMRAGAHALTDVTGFGLLGHALEMAEASGVCLELDVSRLPLLAGAVRHARAGGAPGGTARNRAAYEHRTTGLSGLEVHWADVLCDPQTSGGLLVALDDNDVAGYLASLEAAGGRASVVGCVRAGRGARVRGQTAGPPERNGDGDGA